MRNPAIHLLKSELCKLIQDGEERGYRGDKLAGYILANYSNSLQHRNRVQLKSKEKLVVSLGSVKQFLGALFDVRQKDGKGRYVKLLEGNSKQMNLAKEISDLAEDFTKEAGKDRYEGYRLFCEIGVMLMGNKFGLNKFKSLAPRIFEYLDYSKLVDNDPKQGDTIKFFQIYAKKIENETGVKYPLKKGDYIRFVDFYFARKQADTLKANYTDFINAQFEGLNFLGVLPMRYNLHGDSATDFYYKYMAQDKKKKATEEKHGGSSIIAKI